MEENLKRVLNLLNDHIKGRNLTIKLVCMSDGQSVSLFYVAQLGSGDFEKIASRLYRESDNLERWYRWINYHIDNPKS